MQNYDIIPDSFLKFDLKEFLDTYKHKDPAEVALGLKQHYDFNKALLADQLKLHKKAIKKLPTFAQSYCFFTPKSYEQASSEHLARYKTTLVSGRRMLDLSAGLGVDDWAFSSIFREVVALDPDRGLNAIARCNYEKLGITNIKRIDSDAETFLASCTQHFDLVYLDADRRTEGKKAITLYDGEPDLMKLLPAISALADCLLIKLSPLTDLTHILRALKHVQEIHVVSQLNEVKEVLVLCQNGYSGPAKIIAADIEASGAARTYSSLAGEETKIRFSEEGGCLYEPALCLIKAGLAAGYCAKRGLAQVGPGSLFFVSETLAEDFMGRPFLIRWKMPYEKKLLTRYLEEAGLDKANVARRNFPLDVASIRKQFRLQEGGEDYLFFTTAISGKMVFHCRKP